jgi:hypothetical protein
MLRSVLRFDCRSRLGITTRHRAGLVGSDPERTDSLGLCDTLRREDDKGERDARDHAVEPACLRGRVRDPAAEPPLRVCGSRMPVHLAVFFRQCLVLWSQGRTLPFDSVVSEEAVPLGCSRPDNSFMCSTRLFGRMSVQC